MLQEKAFPIGQWLPDTPDYMINVADLTVCKGVYPRTKESYGSLATPAVFSSALAARCQGGISARSPSGVVATFAGTATDLYQLSSAAAWTSVSKSAAAYSTGTDETWRFAVFGSRVLGVNYAQDVQVFVLDSSAVFADLAAGTAPKARFVTTWDPGFAVLANVQNGSGTFPSRVWWSAINDATSWPTPGTAAAQAVQSDYNDLPSGGWIQGITGPVGGAQGSVFCDKSIFRVEYIGTPQIFAFREVVRGHGTPAVNSLVSQSVSEGVVVVFFLSDDGFYVFDGSSIRPIGHERVDKFFYNEVDQTYMHRIVGIDDPLNKQVIWGYPVSGSGGNIARWLIYNWAVDRWSYVDDSSIAAEWICQVLSAGYTLEGLDSISTNLDTGIPFSLDSRLWSGGKAALAMYDANHKLNYFTGANMAVTMETGEVDGGDGRRLYTNGIRVMCDGGTVTAAVGYRDTPKASITYSSATSPDADGICHQHQSARYMRARASVTAGSTFNHLFMVAPQFRQEGAR